MNTREVRLTQGKTAIVDEADFDWIMRWKWCARRMKSVWYAGRRGPDYPGQIILMHRVLTFAQKGEDVDHVDGNGLNNTQVNLRRCAHRENMRGFRRKALGKTSKFRGVCWDARRKKWRATINIREGVQKHLGQYSSEEAASQAYANAARLHFGAFAAANIFSQEIIP